MLWRNLGFSVSDAGTCFSVPAQHQVCCYFPLLAGCHGMVKSGILPSPAECTPWEDFIGTAPPASYPGLVLRDPAQPQPPGPQEPPAEPTLRVAGQGTLLCVLKEAQGLGWAGRCAVLSTRAWQLWLKPALSPTGKGKANPPVTSLIA